MRPLQHSWRAADSVPDLQASSPLLTSAAVMVRLGYKNRSSFWQFIKSSGVPHIRLNQRRIMFDPRALNAWLDRRSIGSVRHHR